MSETAYIICLLNTAFYKNLQSDFRICLYILTTLDSYKLFTIFYLWRIFSCRFGFIFGQGKTKVRLGTYFYQNISRACLVREGYIIIPISAISNFHESAKSSYQHWQQNIILEVNKENKLEGNEHNYINEYRLYISARLHILKHMAGDLNWKKLTKYLSQLPV